MLAAKVTFQGRAGPFLPGQPTGEADWVALGPCTRHVPVASTCTLSSGGPEARPAHLSCPSGCQPRPPAVSWAPVWTLRH